MNELGPVHVSIDLETLGKNPQAMIVSIGAVIFDPYTGELGDSFYRVIDLEAPGGGVMDVSTVLWWMRQDEAARKHLFAPETERVPLQHALVDLSEWLGLNDELETEFPNVHLWQRGDKDAMWLTSAYEGTGLRVPFPYWAVSDQRTLCRWIPADKVEREGTHHNALDDAKYQAQCIAKAFDYLLKDPAVWVEEKADGLAVRCENERGSAAVYVNATGLAHEVFAASAIIKSEV
uniref:3'-5' exoribonuclease Rv2179c-like domain-containing protein n=1 Tax=viral metagenome TaxID=1070528 RepID=A0A6M3MIG8_9ZZZZ